MIKRRYYRLEHGNRDAPSESSSSSDSEEEAEATDETEDGVEEEEEDENEDGEGDVAEVRAGEEASSSSGYESEDSSANDVNLDSSGLPSSDDDVPVQSGDHNIKESQLCSKGNPGTVSNQHGHEDEDSPFDSADCVVKVKSVFKCRLCPRIVCLSEETLKAHLNSKRHARSIKLLKEGRLKLMLNSEGQIEGESDSEKHAVTAFSGEEFPKSKKKGKGGWKQKRSRKNGNSRMGKARHSSKNQRKKFRRDSP